METPSKPTYSLARERLRERFSLLQHPDDYEAQRVLKYISFHYINSLPRSDFEYLKTIQDEDQLLRILGDPVITYVRELDQTLLNGFPFDLIALLVLVCLVHAFQVRSNPAFVPGWTVNSAFVVAGFVTDREKEDAKADALAAQFDSLGRPSESTEAIQPDPTKSLLARTDLAPETKVNVLRNALEFKNRVGLTTPDGVFRTGYIRFHSRSLEAARRFFSVNPAICVNDLIGIIAESRELLQEPLPPPYEEDTKKHLRRSHDLSYLLQMLRAVLKEYGDLPVERYLTKKELFGANFELEDHQENDDSSPPPVVKE